jgi:hypothetical protein
MLACCRGGQEKAHQARGTGVRRAGGGGGGNDTEGGYDAVAALKAGQMMALHIMAHAVGGLRGLDWAGLGWGAVPHGAAFGA